MPKKAKTFEKAMEELESVVADLEEGELPLAESLKKFEEGLSLSQFLSKTLDDMEKKVVVLMRDKNGKIKEAPYQSDD